MQSHPFRSDQMKVLSTLPSPPGLVSEFLRMSRQTKASLDDFAKMVQADPATAGRILKLANSGSLGRSTFSIVEAIERLGISAVQRTCLAFSVPSKARASSDRGFNFNRFWSQSFARAIAMRELNGLYGLVSADEGFASGLLSRVGELALATVYSGEGETPLGNGAADGEANESQHPGKCPIGVTAVQFTVALWNECQLPSIFVDTVQQTARPMELAWATLPRQQRLAELLSYAAQIGDLYVNDGESIAILPQRCSRLITRLQISTSDLVRVFEVVASEWTNWKTLVGGSETPTVKPVSEPVLARQSPVAEPLPSLTVLVAEDNEAQRKLMSRFLQSAGHVVITTDNGETALRLALENEPQVVVADWQMPRMDGLTLCAALRRAKIRDGVYFMLVTGETDENLLVHAFDSGVDDFVTKPVLPRAFLARMKAAQRLIQVEAEIRKERTELRRLTTELGVANRKLELAALTDSLTDLPNRRCLTQQVERLWPEAKRKNIPLSCLLIDVDHFKSINDRYGHAVGDTVLRELASCLRQSKRDEDFVCRYGGEEFAVLLPHTDTHTAIKVAERLRVAVERDVAAREPILQNPVTISVGVGTRNSQMIGPETLLDQADQALYAAKSAGRNRTCVIPIARSDELQPAK